VEAHQDFAKLDFFANLQFLIKFASLGAIFCKQPNTLVIEQHLLDTNTGKQQS
jgi:hypothetical protein